MTNVEYILPDSCPAYDFSETEIDSRYPFKPHTVPVLDSYIHYIDEGQSENTILFLHGIPAWSYTWRNVLPEIAKHWRCVAPDLIGLGRSGKPDIQYTVLDHIKYIEEFINALDLKNIILVLHAWGSVIGFDYARRHPDKVKAIAFTEAHICPPTHWNMLPLPIQELASIREAPDRGFDKVMNKGYYINTVLPNTILRRLSKEEAFYYAEPFKEPGSAKPLWQYCQEFPLGTVTPLVQLIESYAEWLQSTDIPKLMLYSIPGYLTMIETIQWCRANLSNIKIVDAGDGLHYPQEENPHIFAAELNDWLKGIQEARKNEKK